MEREHGERHHGELQDKKPEPEPEPEPDKSDKNALFGWAKNVNRKVVRATYTAEQRLFKIPDGLDLDDKTQVSEWFVRYDFLHIVLLDGTTVYGGTVSEPEVEDTKEPKEATVEDAEDFAFSYENDELDKKPESDKKPEADNTTEPKSERINTHPYEEEEGDGEECKRCGKFIDHDDDDLKCKEEVVPSMMRDGRKRTSQTEKTAILRHKGRCVCD